MIKKSVRASENLSEPAVIGYFEGKSGDGTITNENGLDIGVGVWEAVFESDEFKDNLKNGFYIGFLGHPEDPGCQDFEHACIVLRDAYIDDKGEVYSKCDLINTPVGRIVKTFIDAGVHFGLSVRGAGTINGSTVEPDDFVFRGFDVVAFPAYKDAIPEFKEIAASSDIEDRKKYRKICASVNNELPNIDDTDTLYIVQDQFGENSDVYRNIQNRIDELSPCTTQNFTDDCLALQKQKFDGLMNLYLNSLETIRELSDQLAKITSECAEKERKLTASTRIYHNQIDKMTSNYNSLLASEQRASEKRYKKIESSNNKLRTEKKDITKDIEKLQSSIKKYEVKCSKLEQENQKLSDENKEVVTANKQIQNTLDKVKDINLKCKYKIDAGKDELEQKDSVIASLKTQLRETVNGSEGLQGNISNLESDNHELKSDVKEALDLVTEYQNAYAELYASILGVSPDGITVDTMTSVSELKDAISSSTSTVNIGVKPDILGFDDEEEYYDDEDEYYEEDVDYE